MPEFPIEPDLAAVSRALGGLVPQSPSLDRDRLLYEAGRKSVRSRPWPFIAGLFAVLSVGLSARMAMITSRVEVVYVSRDPVGREAERSAYVASRARGSASRLTEVPTLEPLRSAPGYLGLRDQVVRFGVDSLPAVSPGAAGPEPSVEQLLGMPDGTLDDAQKSRLEHQLYRGGV